MTAPFDATMGKSHSDSSPSVVQREPMTAPFDATMGKQHEDGVHADGDVTTIAA